MLGATVQSSHSGGRYDVILTHFEQDKDSQIGLRAERSEVLKDQEPTISDDSFSPFLITGRYKKFVPSTDPTGTFNQIQKNSPSNHRLVSWWRPRFGCFVFAATARSFGSRGEWWTAWPLYRTSLKSRPGRCSAGLFSTLEVVQRHMGGDMEMCNYLVICYLGKKSIFRYCSCRCTSEDMNESLD